MTQNEEVVRLYCNFEGCRLQISETAIPYNKKDREIYHGTGECAIKASQIKGFDLNDLEYLSLGRAEDLLRQGKINPPIFDEKTVKED